MKREHDRRTGRPLVDGRDNVGALTLEELEAEVTIAASEPRHRASRLNCLLRELERRRRHQPLSPMGARLSSRDGHAESSFRRRSADRHGGQLGEHRGLLLERLLVADEGRVLPKISRTSASISTSALRAPAA